MAKQINALCYYNNKVVDMSTYINDPKMRFKLACMRIHDNSAEGYVIEIDGDNKHVYSVTKSSKMAKILVGEARDKVLMEIDCYLATYF